MRKLNALKNIGWAFAIVLCLAIMLVATLVAAFTRYPGPKERGGVHLGDGGAVSSAAVSDPNPAGIDGGMASLPGAEGDGTLHALAESADGGQAYIDSLTFLVDSSLIGLRDAGVLSGGTETTQVWGSVAGNLPAAELATCTIRYPNDGSQIPASAAAMVARPDKLVICLGSDGLGEVDKESFKQNYTALIEDIRKNSPDTTIILCSLGSVSPSYNGTDGLNSYIVGEANDWIREICSETGVLYADTGSVVRDPSGTLITEYAAANGKTLNTAGLTRVLQYLRTHTA